MSTEERRLKLAAKAMQRSNEEGWVVCLVSARQVGRRDGGTARLADVLNKSISQVENYADAGKGYQLFRKMIFPGLRRRLHPAHFRELYRVWKSVPQDKKQFIVDNSETYLFGAMEMNMTAEDMRDSLLAECGVAPKTVELGRKWWERGWKAIETSAIDHDQREEALGLFRKLKEILK